MLCGGWGHAWLRTLRLLLLWRHAQASRWL
jgi:hypothetical protein